MDAFKKLEQRRQELGMSRSALAERSRVSLPTTNRILSGGHSKASFANVVAIAEALGMDLTVQRNTPSEEFRRTQAMNKARRLVSLVQGTSALEGQGLDQDEIEEMVGRTFRELLPANRKLWAE